MLTRLLTTSVFQISAHGVSYDLTSIISDGQGTQKEFIVGTYTFRVPTGGNTAPTTGLSSTGWTTTDAWQGTVTTIGHYVSSGWSILSDGGLQASYTGGDYCDAYGYDRSAYVQFHCASTSSQSAQQNPMCICKFNLSILYIR